MSQEEAARAQATPCPACGSLTQPQVRPRPPLELCFCTDCGTLRGAQLHRGRLGAVTSPVPEQILSMRTASEFQAGAGAGRLRTSTPTPARLRPPPAPSPVPEPATAVAPSPASAAQPVRTKTPPPTLDPGFGYPKVLIGDPSQALRDQARDMLLVRGIAEDVVTAKDGGQLLVEFARCCREGAPPNLVVLDTALPLLDGKNVAILLRSIEDAFSLESIPIVFYVAKEPDAPFHQLCAYLKNARLVRRDATASPEVQVQVLTDALST